MTHSLMMLTARAYAHLKMDEAWAAKAKGRPTVVAHYVRQARQAMHDARRGRFSLMDIRIA